MTTLETLLKQVEELDAEWNQSPPSTNYERMATVEDKLATAAPILVEVIRKLVEQRDDLATDVWHFPRGGKITRKTEIAKLNTELDAIVAKRLKGEGGAK